MQILTLFLIFFTISFSLLAEAASVSGNDLNNDVNTGFVKTDKKPVMKKSDSVFLGDNLHYLHYCNELFEKEYALNIVKIIKTHSPADWNRVRRGIQENKGRNYICRGPSDSMYMGDFYQSLAENYMKKFSEKLKIKLDTNFDIPILYPPDNSNEKRLKKLKSLYDNQLITKEEYDLKRKEILDQM